MRKEPNGTISITPEANKKLKMIRVHLKKKIGFDVRASEIVSKLILDYKIK